MLSLAPTNHLLPRPANPTHPPNWSGEIGHLNAVGSFRSDRQSCCRVIVCGIRSGYRNLLVRSHKDSDSCVDPAVDARSFLSSAVVYQQPPSPRLLQPVTPADLSQPPAQMQVSRLCVAYKGSPGSRSEVATSRAYPNGEAVSCYLFETAFEAVKLGVVDRAVIPLETSIDGIIHHNFELLLENRLHIVGEINLPIHHCLLALPGVRLEHLSVVISHPQALVHCERSLAKLTPGATLEVFYDSVGAAEYIAMNKLHDMAAIANSRAAEIFGLQVLADSIEDDSSNITRYVKLAREPFIPATDRQFKTSIVISHDQGADILFEILSVFESRGIKLTKIVTMPRRSRPIRIAGKVTKEMFQCLSYVDLAASMAEQRMTDILEEVRKVSSFVRVLGSYPTEVTSVGG